MRNLKKELVNLLKYKNRSLDDIIWISLDNKELVLNQFLEGMDVEYNDDYSRKYPELNESLKIFGEDFLIYVDDYDGALSLAYLYLPSRKKLNGKDKADISRLLVKNNYDDDDE